MYDDEMEFTDETLQNGLRDLIEDNPNYDEILWENMQVSTFEEAGVMTYDKGLIIRLPDGTEYQLTIIQSR